MVAKIIEFKIPLQTSEVMYLTGETLLTLIEPRGVTVFDTAGTPVVAGEFYEITADGAKRIE